MKVDVFIREVKRLYENAGVEGKKLDGLVGHIASLYSQHNERVVERFEKELGKGFPISLDTQDKREAILKCIGIIERETGLVLSEHTTHRED
jgi:hypothetical protein